MAYKYKNLVEVLAAFDTGDLNATENLMVLDNDAIVVYDGDTKVYEGHPDFVLEEALNILGIPWEHV